MKHINPIGMVTFAIVAISAYFLNSIRELLIVNNQKLKQIMNTQEEFRQVLDEIKASTNKVSDDMVRLIDKLANGGLTPQQEGETLAELRDHAAKLKSIDELVPEEETPPPPPVDPPAEENPSAGTVEGAGNGEITG